MGAVAWDFEARNVVFTLSIAATFDTSIGAASLSIPWFDAAGVLAAPATIGPFNTLEVEPVEPDGQPVEEDQPEVVKAKGRKELPPLPINFETVQALRHASLPISLVGLGEAGEEVATPARLHLGPLLLANKAAAGSRTSTKNSHGSAASAKPAKPRESTVLAVDLDGIHVDGLHSLEVTLTTDIPCLTMEMMERLKPLCFTIEAVEDLPNESFLPEVCEDVYVEVLPRLSGATAGLAEAFPAARTVAKAHGRCLTFSHPVVWFLGLVSPHTVREWLEHEGIVVEIHDRDVRVSVPEGDEDEVAEGGEEEKSKPSAEEMRARLVCQGQLERKRPNAYGETSFALGPLTEARSLQLPLHGGVVPGRCDKQRRQPEGGLGKLAQTPEYHVAGTVCVVLAELAVPLPDAREVQASEERARHEQWVASEERIEETNIWRVGQSEADAEGASPGLRPYRAKTTNPEGEEVVGPWRRRREDAAADERRLRTGQVVETPDEALHLTKECLDTKYERYGRIVVIAEESEHRDMVSGMAQQVLTWNARVKGFSADISQAEEYCLTEAEKKDPHLDIVSGFDVFDGRVHHIVLEGLRHRGLQELSKTLCGDQRPANSTSFKMLHNPQVGFSQRLYADYGGLKLKQIMIRKSLKQLACEPTLYVAKEDGGNDDVAVQQALKLLMELKTVSRLQALRQGNAFPKMVHLHQLEAVHGIKPGENEDKDRTCPVTKVKSRAETLAQTRSMEDALERTMMKKPEKRKPQVDQKLHPATEEHRKLKQSASAPNFISTNRSIVGQMSETNSKINDVLGKKRTRQTPFLEGQQVHLYSGQKFASVELQKEWMRKHMDANEDGASWTFNANYMSQAFEFSGAQEPGLKAHVPRCPNDTHANVEGDDRPAFRTTHSRPPEHFRKPTRDVCQTRKENLREAFVDGEWHKVRLGEDRVKPVSVQVRHEPGKIPHMRKIAEKPFDKGKLQPGPANFGPRSMYESVHYHGRRAGETLSDEAERANVRERERHAAKMKGPATIKPHNPEQGHVLEATLSQESEYHELGNPTKQWHARLRENDQSPPYCALSGTYLKRDPEVGVHERALMSGTLGKAPWQHCAEANGCAAGGRSYPSTQDFNVTRSPAKSRQCEEHLHKNASRSAIHDLERSASAYRRPADYGVHSLF